jgi:5-formyltetrahydrofolate cyclo-ligase
MLKSDLRLKYIELRDKLPKKELLDSSLIIANKLLELPIWEFDYYHLFLSISKKKEIDTSFVLSILQGRDKNVILPKIQGERLVHYLLTDGTAIKKNKWNVPEPIDGIAIEPLKIDVVFVPLLAFDVHGNRVGYGKGYYDGFLKQCRPDVLKIGLSLFEAEDEITDAFENDIPLDYCITPNTSYRFSLTS